MIVYGHNVIFEAFSAIEAKGTRDTLNLPGQTINSSLAEVWQTRDNRMRELKRVRIWLPFVVLILITGCGRKKVVQVPAPPPPMTSSVEPGAASGTRETTPVTPDSKILKNAKPIFVETGMASWYGPPYNHRQSSNGEIYDMHALTAAHRTLPLNSIARVTNLQTGHSTIVRITDRGPFIEQRMLDLSLAAAKKVDVWQPGLAKVKLEVIYAPVPINSGGHWCVQIGAFHSRQRAAKLKQKIQRRYRQAEVLQFKGPTGEWIRVRVPDDDKARAEKVLREVVPSEGAAFLVRLD